MEGLTTIGHTFGGVRVQRVEVGACGAVGTGGSAFQYSRRLTRPDGREG